MNDQEIQLLASQVSDSMGGERPSPLVRFGQGVANIVPEMLNAPGAILNAVVDPTGSLGGPAQIPNFFDLPEARTTGERIADTASELTKLGATFATGEGIGMALARGLGPVAARSAGFAAGNALTVGSRDPENALAAGVAGAALGPLHALPVAQRIVPALGIAGAHAAARGNTDEILNDALLGIVGSRIGKPREAISDARIMADNMMTSELGGIPVNTPPPVAIPSIDLVGQSLDPNLITGLRTGATPRVAPINMPATALANTPLSRVSERKGMDFATLQERPASRFEAELGTPITPISDAPPVFFNKATGPAPKRMAVQEVEGVVNDLTANWKNKPEIQILETAPTEHAGAAGVYQGGKVTVYADRLKNPRHAIEVALEETVGHHGLLQTLGEEGIGPAMDIAEKGIAKNRLKKIANQYGYDLADKLQRRKAVEEYVAKQASSTKVMTKVITYVKDYLEKTFGVKFKDSYVRQLIKNSRKYVVEGGDPQKALVRLTEPKFAIPPGAARDLMERTMGNFGSTVIGAAIGGTVAGTTDNRLSMTEGIVLGGLFGAAGPRVARHFLGKSATEAAGEVLQRYKGKSPKAIVDEIFNKNSWEQYAAEDTFGRGDAVAKFARFLEKNTKLNLPREIQESLLLSDGEGVLAIKAMDESLRKASKIKVEDALKDKAQAYLSGKIDEATFKSGLSSMEEKLYGDFITTGRNSIKTLQEMLTKGLPEGSFKNMILDSIKDNNYLARTFRIFNDKHYFPSKDQTDKVFTEVKALFPEYHDAQVESILKDYLYEIKKAKASYFGSTTKEGQKLDSVIFHRRKDLSPEFRDMLGEYTDPTEKLMQTARRLLPSAKSAQLFDLLSKTTDSTGLKFTMDGEELSKTLTSLEDIIKRGLASNIQKKQFATLQNYVRLDEAPRHGKLGGKWVDRRVSDQLSTFDSPWGMMDGAVMSWMKDAHNFTKIGRTALNPIVMARNIVGVLPLSAISRVNPAQFKTTWNILQEGVSNPMYKEMVLQGILQGDQVTGEFMRDAGKVFSSTADAATAMGKLEAGWNKALDWYKIPDQLHRGATYLSAKNRISKQLGLALDDPTVIKAAREWTDRYTPNHAMVAPAVKTLRQLPFTNLFLSYTAEITRISKNLVEDVIKSSDPGQRVHAASMLAGLAVLPLLAEKASVLAMSKKDQEDWNRTVANQPAYARPRNKIVTGRDEKGNFHYVDFSPLIQVDNLVQTIRSLLDGDVEAVGAVNPIFGWENTPLLNIAASQITGEDIHTHKPINGGIERVRNVIKELIPPILPPGYEADRIARSLTPNDEGGLGITNERTGRIASPSQLIGSYLSGLRFAQVNPTLAMQSTISQSKRQIANELSVYREIANSNYGPETKERARQKYIEATTQIVASMHERLGLD